MQYSDLSTVKHRIFPGAPLPFNVRDADRTLLLAKGQVVATREQLESLFRRGALVDIAELMSEADRIRLAPKDKLPALWRDCFTNVGDVLRSQDEDSFRMALESMSDPVLALVARDPDLAIFQVLRQDANDLTQYGIDHSLHAAVAAHLVARRLNWTDADQQRAFKAALTMNLSMLELQGHLARQGGPITPEQREAVRAHPEISRRMLELAGVTDADWLRAVGEHHEEADGSGYPLGSREVSDLAAIIRRGDLYAAKLSPRETRTALPADVAVRSLFVQDAGHPMTAALVKEFGMYPPGCFVRLTSGEAGVVIQRGPTVATPVVAVLSSPSGQALPMPLRRDTTHRSFTVEAVIPTHPGYATVRPEDLMLLKD